MQLEHCILKGSKSKRLSISREISFCQRLLKFLITVGALSRKIEISSILESLSLLLLLLCFSQVWGPIDASITGFKTLIYFASRILAEFDLLNQLNTPLLYI